MNIFRRNRSEFSEFQAMVGRKATRSELVHLHSTLTAANAHPGKIRAIEKRIARLDGFRGA